MSDDNRTPGDGDPCPDCAPPHRSVSFGSTGDRICLACLWPHRHQHPDDWEVKP